MAFKMKGFPKNGDPKKAKVKVKEKSEDGRTFLATDGNDYLTRGYDGDIAVGDSVPITGDRIDVKALEAAMAVDPRYNKPEK